MGVCASSQSLKATKSRDVSGSRTEINIRRWPSVATVIHVDGRMEEYKTPTKASNVISQNPGHFLCSSESMSIGTCTPHVSEEEDLMLGQIYFVMPLSEAQNPLSLQDLCSLAIKASSAIGKHRKSFDFYPTNSKLVFR